MARIRTVKPEFWVDDKVVELDPWARLLFIGMWNFADDQGYIDFSPKRIKMQVFPGDTVDVVPLIDELLKQGLIRSYMSPIGPVLHVANWARHQRVDHAAKRRFDPVLLSPFDPHDPSGSSREAERCTCSHKRAISLTEQGYLEGTSDPREPSRGLVGDGQAQISRSENRSEESEREATLFVVDPREPSRTLAPEGKGKEGKGSKNICSTEGRATVQYPPEFERTYAAYPRKIGKAKALRAWLAAVKVASPETIYAGVQRYAAETVGTEARFIAHPASWLNAHRWQDEATPPPRPPAANGWRPYRNPDNPDTAYNGYKLGRSPSDAA